MKQWLYCEDCRGCRSVGLLALRVVVGAAFVLHGWTKIQSPMDWMGADATVPGVFQCLAAVSEFGGGMALVLGFLTPLAALGLGCTMVVAITTYHLPQGHPFVAPQGGPSFELASAYLASVVLLLLLGPGRLSLDFALFGKRPDAKQ
jgi:putative oxidoreductase